MFKTIKSFSQAPQPRRRNRRVRKPGAGVAQADVQQLEMRRLLTAAFTAVPAIVNGSFELPSMAAVPNTYQYDPTGAVWTFAGQSGITASNNVWRMENPPDGNQAAFLQGVGSMSQSITGLTVGSPYLLRFMAEQRPDNGVSGGDNPIVVSVDGHSVLGPSLPPQGAWSPFATAPFVATAATETVMFAGTRAANGGTTFVDAVSIGSGAPPPNLLATRFGDGISGGTITNITQRSEIRDIQLQFDHPVSLATAAVKLVRYSGDDINGLATDASAALGQPTSSDGMTWIVPIRVSTAFSDKTGSLTNGVYQVTIVAGNVTDSNANHLDHDQSATFFRLFGDINGDGIVNNSDYLHFSRSFFSVRGSPRYNADFDVDGSGSIGNPAYFAFTRDFGKRFSTATILNGGFEAPVEVAGGYQYDPSGAVWSFAGSAGITARNNVWRMYNPPDGNQAAFLQGTGSMSQQLTGLTVGDVYTVHFFAAQRSDNGFSNGRNPFVVSVGGQTVSGPTLPPSTDWTAYITSKFVATGPSETLVFAGTGTDPSGPAVFIDAVTVTLE